MLNTASGLHLTLHPSGALVVERSLPKALTGSNVDDLRQDQVTEALAVVDDEILDALGEKLPGMATWAPVRVDYCHNAHLGSESEVARTLEKFARVELPRKGLPTVGQSHSVAWTRGAVRLKVYGKYLETKGDPKAAGVLRFEAGVVRLQSFRDLRDAMAKGSGSDANSPVAEVYGVACTPNNGRTLGRVPLRELKTRRDLRVVDVLTPEYHAASLGRYMERLRGDAMSEIELSDLAFMRELFDFFGVRHAVVVMGWCTTWHVLGVQSRADALASGYGHLASRYRVLDDIRRFRAHLVAKGVLVDDHQSDDKAVDALLVHLGELKAA
jgi:hypothetical protein